MIHLCCSDSKKAENKKLIEILKNSFEINDDLKRIDSNEFPILAIGGDGTLNYLCNQLPDSGNFKVLYMPQGTANDFAKSLKLEELSDLPNIESIIKNSALVTIPVMYCNDKKFINVASFGEPARVTNEGKSLLKEYTGKLSYYLSAIDTMINPQKLKLKIFDGTQEKEVETFGGFVSQGLFVGGGVRVNCKGCVHFQEKFNLLLVDSTNMSDSLNTLITLQTGSKNTNDFLIDTECEELNMRSEEMIKLKLDGEMYEAKSLVFKKSNLKLEFYLY